MPSTTHLNCLLSHEHGTSFVSKICSSRHESESTPHASGLQSFGSLAIGSKGVQGIIRQSTCHLLLYNRVHSLCVVKGKTVPAAHGVREIAKVESGYRLPRGSLTSICTVEKYIGWRRDKRVKRRPASCWQHGQHQQVPQANATTKHVNGMPHQRCVRYSTHTLWPKGSVL